MLIEQLPVVSLPGSRANSQDWLIGNLAKRLDPSQSAPKLNTPVGWQSWLLKNFGSFFLSDNREASFASYHEEFWVWVCSLEEFVRPNPLIAVWPREGGKSTNVELAIIYLAHKRIKQYCVYISGTQVQANDHIGNIATALEGSIIQEVDPDLCERQLGKYGHSKAWRMNRLRTSSGLTVDAVGLDAMGRGAKIGKRRPDLIIFDDIDKDNDTNAAVEKKINLLTRKIIPSGNEFVAVLGVQNLIHGQSIFTRLTDGRAEFLSDRVISGPYPALHNFTFSKSAEGKATITSGEPTWDNLSVDRCQRIISDIGLNSFLAEYQHDKSAQQGMFFEDIWIPSILVIDPFTIPAHWRIDRSFDYGYSAPFAVNWWTTSDGETPVGKNRRIYPKGTLFGIHEWYGWNGKANQGCRMLAADIAINILAIEDRTPYLKGRVKPGPADSSIWDGPPNNSVATDMAGKGVHWYAVDKGPGSRINGARMFRERIQASNQTPMTQPGLFLWKNLVQLIRCLPDLPRDPLEPDDVNTEAEDHNFDSSRYRIQWKPQLITTGHTIGMY